MNYKHIGKVKEPHGLKGDLYVLVFSKDTTWLPKLKNLKLKSPAGEELVGEVQSKKPYKDGFLVKLKEVSDRNHSEKVKGFEVWISEDLLVSQKGETIYLNEILGFEVFLIDHCVGSVESISSNGPQDILVIRNEEHVFEVPFVQPFILNLDFEQKRIVMDFPEGLMNLDEQ